MKKNRFLALLLLFFFLLASCNNSQKAIESREGESFLSTESVQSLEPDGYYYELEDLVAYLQEYGHLPVNYITKEQARELDWQIDDGSGLVIGGDPFGNWEGLLPQKPGRQYYEADLVEGYSHHRGPCRLVFSNDGLIFYTDDHYESFEKID